jgi:hypothetical protein
MSENDKHSIKPTSIEEVRQYGSGESARIIPFYPVGTTVIKSKEVNAATPILQDAEVVNLSLYRRGGWLMRILEEQISIYYPER